MRLREMTAEERAVLDELGKEIHRGTRIAPKRWVLPYTEQVGHDGVSNLFYNKMLEICVGGGLRLNIKRGNIIGQTLYFTITIS